MARSNSFVVLTDVRLVRDAEVRAIGEKNLLSFDVADNSGNDKDLTIFTRVTVSGKLADLLSDMKKGDRVNVVGKQTFRTYEKKDGGTGYSFQIDFPFSVTRVFTDTKAADEPEEKVEKTTTPETKRKPGRPAASAKKMPWDDDEE